MTVINPVCCQVSCRHIIAASWWHTASSHVGRFWNNKNRIVYIKVGEHFSTFHNWNYTAATILPPPQQRFHIPRTYPLLPYPHAKDHQPKHSSPFTAPNSYAYGTGKFHRNRHSDISSRSPLRARSFWYRSDTDPVQSQLYLFRFPVFHWVVSLWKECRIWPRTCLNNSTRKQPESVQTRENAIKF